MKNWQGAAGVCINDQNKLLMVLQGTPDEEKTWAIPSGGLENGESFEDCCIREFKEETGFDVEIIDFIKTKYHTYSEINFQAEVQYFFVKIIGGKQEIKDPDYLIYDISWKSEDVLSSLKLTYPEDLQLYNECLHHWFSQIENKRIKNDKLTIFRGWDGIVYVGLRYSIKRL